MNSSWQSIISDQAAAAQILGWGAGGKNSGIVGLWDCGEIAISEISESPLHKLEDVTVAVHATHRRRRVLR